MPLGIRSKIQVFFSHLKTCWSYVDFSIVGHGRINYVTIAQVFIGEIQIWKWKKIKKGLSNKSARIANSKE